MTGYFGIAVITSILVTALFSRIRRDAMDRSPTIEADAELENRLERIASRDE